jgi:lactoylglutathione lyase
MIKQINTVAIYVEDQDRAVRFYVEKLGFTVHADRPMRPARWIEVGPANAQSRFVIFPRDLMPDWAQRKASVVLLCDDAEATFRELSARGVTFTEPPKRMDYGTFGVFADVDGNQLAIMSPYDAS